MTDKANLQNQRGSYILSLSAMMIVLFLVTIGMARSNTNTLRATTGQSIGNQLTMVANGLSNYIGTHNAEIIADAGITGVTTTRSPTIPELQALNYLSTNVGLVPTNGTAYEINISVTPNGCTTTCQVVGMVYMQNPIRNSEGKSIDIRILGSAVTTSAAGNIGFSLPETPGIITGPGWTLPNPDPSQRPGILLIGTGIGGGTGASAMYWKAPVANYASLPTAGNIVGDGRVTLDTYRAFIWGGTSWKAVAADQNGDLAVSGNIAAVGNLTTVGGATIAGLVNATAIADTGGMAAQTTTTNSVTLNSSIASSGGSCSGTTAGTIAKDASGNLYVCR